jgi:hypothetical protein
MSETNEHKIALKAIVEAEIFQLVPTLLEAERAKEQFLAAPSIQTGVRKFDAECAASHAIDKAASNIWSKWSAE